MWPSRSPSSLGPSFPLGVELEALGHNTSVAEEEGIGHIADQEEEGRSSLDSGEGIATSLLDLDVCI